jgi:DNA-binding SARP family transcriptional activator
VRFGVLGSLRVVQEGAEVPVPGARQQALLAALVLARGRTVSPEALVDTLWEENPPAGASATLQTYVSRLRTALGHDAVVLEPGGYRLVADPDDLDLVHFDRLADEGASALRGRDTVRAEGLLQKALGLWRGTALEGFAGRPFARPEAVRLEERRLAAEEQLCTALLASGAVAEAADRLTRIVESHPLREEARRLHALALYRSNRQSDALASLADARQRLREELGLDPGRPLRELEEQLLRQDRTLDPPPAAAQEPQPTLALPASPPVTHAPVLCPVLIGRDDEVGVLRTALAEAGRGGGGTVVLVGHPGAGKSRLVREVLGRSERVLEGRAVAGPVPVPFRPLVEALQSGLRRAERRPDVGPYRAALGRLVPEWHDPAAPLSPLPHLAEGVLRLLRSLTGNGPLVLVIEDLHWADDETLAVLEYLADNLAGEQLLLVLTTRADEGPAALRLASTLELRRSARVLRLPPLAEAEVRAMVAACLPGRPSAELVETLVARSHGVPLFVEELLAVADSAGHAVPATFGQAVRARTGALTADNLRVLRPPRSSAVASTGGCCHRSRGCPTMTS